jgi:hypothetical protein
MSPMPAGERLSLRFRMPGQRREVEAEGRVAWSDRKVGMGIQFERVDAADQGVIDGFVDQHFFSNRKA